MVFGRDFRSDLSSILLRILFPSMELLAGYCNFPPPVEICKNFFLFRLIRDSNESDGQTERAGSLVSARNDRG